MVFPLDGTSPSEWKGVVVVITRRPVTGMSNVANYSKAVVLVVIRIHFETFSGQRRTGERAPVGGT